jgi:dTDP-4-amino-4,6-dideoxygalactose transaminase
MTVMPIIKPTLPALDEVLSLVRTGWDAGVVTVGPTVRSLEEEACRHTGARYAVALSSRRSTPSPSSGGIRCG